MKGMNPSVYKFYIKIRKMQRHEGVRPPESGFLMAFFVFYISDIHFRKKIMKKISGYFF